MDSSIDHAPAGERWQFDEQVAGCFDDMLARSIPAYDAMRSATLAVGSRFVRPGTDVLDLGCSRGRALLPFVERFRDTGVRFIGVEVSAPMRDEARALLGPDALILDTDLRGGLPVCRPSLTLAVLTLQFVPLELRRRVLARTFDATTPGGALIVVEKILGETEQADRLLVDLYYDLKHANGYSRETIEEKRKSLEGVLVPVTATWNETMLRDAGFSHVECFWRYLNFAAWVAIKPGGHLPR